MTLLHYRLIQFVVSATVFYDWFQRALSNIPGSFTSEHQTNLKLILKVWRTANAWHIRKTGGIYISISYEFQKTIEIYLAAKSFPFTEKLMTL